MDNIIRLSGLESDKDTIKANGTDAAYVLDAPQTKFRLGDYIDKLHAWGVKNRTLSALRVCSNVQFRGQICVETPGRPAEYPPDMAALLTCLKPEKQYTVIITNDDRTLLAAILQQLVYVEYPLNRIGLELSGETKDKVHGADFTRNCEKLLQDVQNTERKLDGLRQSWWNDAGLEDKDRLDLDNLYSERQQAFERIRRCLDKMCDDEIKIVIAASKKTGKSTIVNSIIGTELAPTSLERPTPNTCIYRKSTDGQYHLHCNDVHRAFPNKAEIVRVLRDAFERARSRTDGSTCLPDMEVEYVAPSDGFDRCVIYDTPGPDLAGARGHMESAYQAIAEGDVILFAVDFEKAITTSEEEYLRHIKHICDERGKVHSLIFSVNKMDQALPQSEETQSPIKSTDWIRRRLVDIDPGYADCVLFAISALDYFNTLELEEQAANYPVLAPLLVDGTNWIGITQDVTRQLKYEGAGDDIIALAANIHNETERLHWQLGIEHVDKEVMQAFSGMPQLLQYLRYVAQKKVRHEALGSIRYEICSLRRSAEDISAAQEKVQDVAHAVEKQIDQFNAILKQYRANVDSILAPNSLTQFDEQHTSDVAKLLSLTNNTKLPISLEYLVERAGKEIRDACCSTNQIALRLWPRFKTAVVNKLKSKKWKKFQRGKAAIYLSDGVTEKLTNELHSCLQSVGSKAESIVKRIVDALKNVLGIRMSELRKKTTDCARQLGTSDTSVHVPHNTSLNVSMILPKPPPISDEIRTVWLNGPLARATEKLWPAHQLARNVSKGRNPNYREVQIRDASRHTFEQILDKYRSTFDDSFRESADYQDKILSRSRWALDNAVRAFGDLTREARNCAKTFLEQARGMEEQHRRLAALQRKETYIADVATVATDFLTAWDVTLGSWQKLGGKEQAVFGKLKTHKMAAHKSIGRK